MASYIVVENLALNCALTDRRFALAHARTALRIATLARRPDLAWRANELIATLGGK